MQLKSKAANMLEDMLLAAYKTETGAKELSVKEKDAIDEKWSKKCENDINHAYSAGTKALALTLQAAISNDKVMPILNK